MSDGPLNVSMKDTDKIIGKFAVLYRNEVKTLAKIESFVKVDEKERRMIYDHSKVRNTSCSVLASVVGPFLMSSSS